MASKPKASKAGTGQPETAGRATYRVLSPVKFDGVRYSVGDTIELADDERDALPSGLLGVAETQGSELIKEPDNDPAKDESDGGNSPSS